MSVSLLLPTYCRMIGGESTSCSFKLLGRKNLLPNIITNMMAMTMMMMTRIRTRRGMSTLPSMLKEKLDVNHVARLYRDREPIVVLTAHDYPSALLADRAQMDIILVGDSLAMVALGYHSTHELTMDEMIHHCRAVARGSKRSLLIGDMPFGSYLTDEDAVRNAVRFIKEGKMEGVKLEGGIEIADSVRQIVNKGIPVMGHVGLMPQKSHSFGGYHVQGKTMDTALGILRDAQALEKAGCFSIVLEAIPEPVAAMITREVHIPTIGIGAGRYTNGQILVQFDMLGMFDRFQPKFVKRYAHLHESIYQALTTYRQEVKQQLFPTEAHIYTMNEVEQKALNQRIPSPSSSS
jgi:3-methyl-2-oxobutanoate hydroxymethyltransferase